MEEKQKPVKLYYCIWTKELVECPIRSKYMLAPESLVPFCAICTELPLHKLKKK